MIFFFVLTQNDLKMPLESHPKNWEKLLKACQKGNRKAQEQLYKHYYAYGMSICIRYVSHKDEAEEVLNDSFMKVFEKIDLYDKQKDFKPWLRRILINTSIDYHRKYHAKMQLLEVNDGLENTNLEEILGAISGQEILNFIQELPPVYRLVFNLHVIEGFSHAEIAKNLDISEGTSRSNLAKAKQKLRKMLKQIYPEYEETRLRG